MENLENIIEALAQHEDEQGVAVLERIGTNCNSDDVRELTAKALARRNTNESLKVLVLHEGKGINDLNPRVAMSTVNEILSLEDKTEIMQVLEDTIEMHSNEEIRETAHSVKALIELS